MASGGRFPRAYEGREEAVDDGVRPFALGAGRVRLSPFTAEGEYWTDGVWKDGGSLVVDDEVGESSSWFAVVVVGCGGGRPLVRYVVEVAPPAW